MVWQIVHNVDTETAKKIPILARSPFLECEGLFVPKQAEKLRSMESKINFDWMLESAKFAENLPSPRVIKTHLPFEFLPPKLLDTCKVIFVCRNPKDACVSFYHHHNNFPEYDMKGSFSDFASMFLKGSIEFGSYWTMLKVKISINFIAHSFLLKFLSKYLECLEA